MATTFKATVQKKTRDNTYRVYIRITHNRKISYLPTEMYIHESKFIDGQIIDNMILGKCAIKIREYMSKLNMEDSESWDIKEVVEFLTAGSNKISFIDYCNSFIDKMRNEGRDRSATNYMCALNSFIGHFGSKVFFQDITSFELIKWIKSLQNMARAKESYPKAIKAMFDAGCLEYNNYDRNMIRISNRPFMGVKIPKHDLPNKKAIESTIIKSILEYDARTKQTEKARDVAKLVFYLVGINTVDLYNLKHENFINGKICYNRCKTKNTRQDRAYIEIAVHPDILYLFEKYKGEERLFDFGYSNERSFNKQINVGLKTISDALKIPQVMTYTFRHSWATIARKNCGFSISDIALCLNHISAHKTTELYIDDNFEYIEYVNNKVIDFIFGKKNKGEGKKSSKRKVKEVVAL